jgi:hypothetical protein
MNDTITGIIEWYAVNCMIITIAVSVIFVVVFYFIKASKKRWNFQEIGLVPIVNLILTISTIPQAIALVLCSFNLVKLEDIQGFNVYIFIAAVALLYVSLSAISKFLKD